MISIGGRYYFVNLEKLDKILNTGSGASDEREIETTTTEETFDEENKLISRNVITTTQVKPKEMDAIRYQILASMIDELLNYEVDEDDSSSIIPSGDLDNLTLGMKITFNTLLEYGVISFIEVTD